MSEEEPKVEDVGADQQAEPQQDPIESPDEGTAEEDKVPEQEQDLPSPGVDEPLAP